MTQTGDPPDHRVSTERAQGHGESDEVDLLAGVSGLAGIVAGARSVNELLLEVADYAARAIPGVDGLGVTVIRPSAGTVEVQAWEVTAPFVRKIDVVQYEVLDEGPCITCIQTQQATVSGSLGLDRRWPRFGAFATELGVHSALSLPLLVAEQVIGSINCYAHDRDAFSEHAVALGSQFARPAAASVYNAQLLNGARERAKQLERALGSRAVIDQAIGIVRGRTGGSAEDGFDRLRRISQSQNIKLTVIAQRIVDEAVRRARARRSSS